MIESCYSFAYLDRKIGPFFDAGGVQAIAALNADELALAERFQDIVFVIANGAERTGADEKLYPAFQFGPRGELLPGLREIAYLLQPATRANAWYLAMWLRTRCDSFEGRPPEEVLRAGLLGPVLDLAKEDFSEHVRQQDAVNSVEANGSRA